MSSITLHTEICPNCGKEQKVERYDSINNYEREVFPKLANGTIFDYECKFCKKIIHSPYPLLFHRMGFRNIMIGYKFAPLYSMPVFPANPFMAVMKKSMEEKGHDTSDIRDIRENYENETEFINRVKEFLD